MIFYWLCNLQKFLSFLFGELKKPTELFKASRSLCFDAGRGCLVIANLLGSPSFTLTRFDGRTDGWGGWKGNAWDDDFFFPGKKRTTTFTFPAKFFWGPLGWKDKHEPWKKRRKQKDDWRSSCPDSESFPFPHQQFVAISHMNGFCGSFMRKPKSSRLALTIPFSTVSLI